MEGSGGAGGDAYDKRAFDSDASAIAGSRCRRARGGFPRQTIAKLDPGNMSVVVHVRLWLSVNGFGKQGASNVKLAGPLARPEKHAASTERAERALTARR
jgi:hypothetical protein